MRRLRPLILWLASMAAAYAAGVTLNSAPAESRRGSEKYHPLRSSGTFLSTTGKDRPHARLERLRRILTEFSPGGLAEMVRLLESATTEDYPELANLMASRSQLSSEAGRMLLSRWGAIDGPAALRWLKSENPQKSGSENFEFVMTGWAASNPSAAMGWIRSPEPGPWRTGDLLRGALQGWAQKDLDAVTVWLGSDHQGFEGEPANYAADLARSILAGRGMEPLLNWIQSLETQPGISAEFKELVFNQTRDAVILTTDVTAAAALLSRNADQPWCRAEDIERVLWSVCDRQPAKVLEVLLQLGPAHGTGKNRLADETMAKWCGYDPAAAANWLKNHTDSPLHSECAAAFARVLADQNSVPVSAP